MFEKWIAEGAEWPGQMDAAVEEGTDLWSFQPVTRPEVPAAGIPALQHDGTLVDAKLGLLLVRPVAVEAMFGEQGKDVRMIADTLASFVVLLFRGDKGGADD